MLACRDVSVVLDRMPVLNGVDLTVDRGEWVALLGPNGAGKSTLLRWISGVVGGAGALSLNGRDAAALRRRERSKLLALVPQTPIIPAGINVADYLLLGRTPHIPTFGVEGPADFEAVQRALDVLDLNDVADRVVDTLSGGERQRVLVARALAQGAPILLLDEPTTALDVGHQQQVLDLVDRLRREQGLTVVAAMHDLTLAGHYADRVVLLDGGKVVIDGKPLDVLTEERLATHFGARVRVVNDGGRPAIVPIRTTPN